MGSYYNVAVLQQFLLDRGLTHREIAEACKTSEKHISNVLAGRTKSARTKVRKKFLDGLHALGAEASVIKEMFTAEPTS
ncbi:MAG: hypothetical protein O9296_17420 [Novosphingobium sp.]|nr:hypothetical protein [Novosphingobium sp.]